MAKPEYRATAAGPKPTIGRIVHYVLPAGPRAGQSRPGMVVNVNPDGTVNLQVFTDSATGREGDYYHPTFHQAEVKRGGTHDGGTWHWSEREG